MTQLVSTAKVTNPRENDNIDFNIGTLSHPADTPLAEVKLNELSKWINRRNVHPVAMAQALSRTYQRFLRRYAQPKYASPTIYFFQFVFATSTLFYFLNYPKSLSKYHDQVLITLIITDNNLSFAGHHKQYKYHW